MAVHSYGVNCAAGKDCVAGEGDCVAGEEDCAAGEEDCVAGEARGTPFRSASFPSRRRTSAAAGSD